MDDREDPDSKVVPFSRKGRSQNGERRHFARKILGDEDEIGAFSLGNLIDPEETAESAPADGHVRDGAEAETESTGSELSGRDADDFFKQLLAQSAAAPSRNGDGPEQIRPLPGSAQLPNELPSAAGAGRPGRSHQLLQGLRSRAEVLRLVPSTAGKQLARQKAFVVAIAAVTVAGVLIASLMVGASQEVALHSPASLARVGKAAKPWVAYSAKPHAVRRHLARPRSTKPATKAPSSSSAAAASSSSSRPAESAPVQAQPVYHSSPPATAASDSGSSSSGGASSSGGQRAGPTSPIGIGTSPSG